MVDARLPLPSRERARIGRDRLRSLAPVAALVLLGAAVLLWLGVFGTLVWQRHERFGSFGFDMGIFDQVIWLAARGETFITVRGLEAFGHHASVAYYLLAPFSWLGAGPHFLNLLQVAALALAAVPLYALGRIRRLPPWVALAPALAFLLHPSTQFLAWELFHPETVAVLPLLLAYVAAVQGRWGWYAGLLVLAVAWKEDVALFAFVLGLVVLLRGERRAGAWTMGLSLTWFVFVTRFLLGAVNGEGAFYEQFYGDLGNGPFQVVLTGLADPTRILDKLTAPDAVSYLWQLSAPWALVSLAAPLVLLAGIPQVVANVLSVHSFTREITFHYAALPMAAFALATVEGLAWLSRRAAGRARAAGRLLAVGVLAAATVATLAWGVSPIGERYDEGFWPRAGDSRRDAKEAALELVPGDAPVSATYGFVPHLTHRRYVYEFPNPFRERNWGVHGEDTHDPSIVEWLVVDLHRTGTEDAALVGSIVAGPDFEVVFERDDVVVARRR